MADGLRIFRYFVNFNERGEFFADIRDENDKTIVTIDQDYAEFLTREKVNLTSVLSLANYLKSIQCLPSRAVVVHGN